MSKRAPSTTQLVVITAFALSCFGILLFLWVTFGGPTPFKAKSYQVTVPFTEAVGQGKVILCRDEVDAAFIREVKAQRFDGPRDLKVIYSQLHGVGA